MKFTERMHEFSKIMFVRLEHVKKEVFVQKNAIDNDYPQWKARRVEFESNYKKYEARREIFVSIVTLIENAQLSYLLIRDHLTEKSWWDQRLEEVSDDKMRSVLQEYALMTKWFLLHGLFSVVEETLRSIQRAAPTEIPVLGRYKSIAKITKAILNASDQNKYENLFTLCRFVRNTIHTNGIFLPENTQNITIEYEEEEFTFVYGESIDWLNDQKAIWLLLALANAMNEIIRSTKIKDIDYCPRTMV